MSEHDEEDGIFMMTGMGVVITMEHMMTVLKAADCFQEMIVESKCDQPGCKNCGYNQGVAEQVKEAIAVMCEGFGITIETITMPEPESDVEH